jgi:hypothetical protein
MKSNLLIISILIVACTPLTNTSTFSDSTTKILRNIDYAYEKEIKTIAVRNDLSALQAYLLPAVTELGQWNLILEFDDLRTDRNNYYARIIHCNQDWSTSVLQDLDYLNDYNEFPINNFEFSVDTHVPYIHYWFALPPVKLPGNYLVVVYRGSDKNDVILSKRFMVFQNRVTFSNERNLIGAGDIASINQQINFTLDYKYADIINPMETVNVSIRQNQRWDNLAQEIKPSFVRETNKELEYRFFDDSKMFKGGNEFRFFDLRSVNSPGRNVASVNKTVKPYEVFIERDKPRTHEMYSQYADYNGNFIPDNLDYRDQNFSNYTYVNFTLASKPLSARVYVTGEFSYWNLTDENLMKYDTVQQQYQARVLLKQGWYDYQYITQSKSLTPYYLEGSHFQTENTYEIFVYYRAFQPRADLLIGYLRLEKNQR